MMVIKIPRYLQLLSRHTKRLLRKSECRMCHSNPSSPASVLLLRERGLFENIFPHTRIPELENLLKTPQTMYCGFDPTADSLHIGNLISITALLHAQRSGHSPIALVGGATAFIGDPSGKTKDRKPLTAQEVERNIKGIMDNVQTIIDNHRQHFTNTDMKLPEFRILNNKDWYKDVNVIDFLSSVGRHFRLGEMISRTSVQNRLNSKEGISCTEFMYQIFQAADWLHLYHNYGCTIQFGGNDQLGNISSGFDLIHKVNNEFVFGLVTPLLLSPSGQKLGKSTGNSVWLSADKTSAYQFYQYFINLPDTELEKYFKLFTFYSNNEIQEFISLHQQSPEKRFGQQKLAESITTLVHGATGLASAQICTRLFFQGDMSILASLSPPELSQLSRNISTTEVDMESSLTMEGLAGILQCFKTDADADRIIKAGGFYINQQRVPDPSHRLCDGDYVLPNNISLVRVGKKTYHLVKWKTL